MIILDTDMLTFIQRQSGEDYARLVARLDEALGNPVFVTIINFEEQTRGWLAYISKEKTLAGQIKAYSRLRTLLEDFQARPVLDFDESAAEVFGQLKKSRVRIGTMDLKIAAISLVQGALLVSRNLKDFQKVPGLDVEDWLKT